MKKLIYILIAAVSLSLFSSCDFEEDIDAPNYASFAENVANVGVDVGSSSDYEVTVYAANVTGQDRQIEIEVNPSSTLSASAYTVPATVTIPGGSNEATVNVQLSDVDLGLAGKTLVLNLKEGNDLFTGDSLAISVTRTCVGKEFVVDFAFDGYGSEISWSIADATGAVLITGGGYADGAASASKSICLGQGTYTFTVEDSYGDGLTYPNLGSITISYAGNVLSEISGDFGSETSEEITF